MTSHDQELDNGSVVGAVFLDFSATFDLINLDLLIAKLRCYGLSTRSLFLIKDYLTDQSQQVFYNVFFCLTALVSTVAYLKVAVLAHSFVQFIWITYLMH